MDAKYKKCKTINCASAQLNGILIKYVANIIEQGSHPVSHDRVVDVYLFILHGHVKVRLVMATHAVVLDLNNCYT